VAGGYSEPDLPAHRAGGRGLSRRRAPDRLAGLVDSHAHLQHARFDADREAVLERAAEAGIERILVPGWDLASSEAALELAARFPGLVDAAVGVHPHDAATMDEPRWAGLERLVADPLTRAVGEIGLDHFRLLSPPEVQREAFVRQLELAARARLPVLVHDRDAHDEVTALLAAWAAGRPSGGVAGVLHAFSGDGAMARRLVGAGFLVSFALPVAFRTATGPREAATELADGAFLVETDAPYLGPDRERRNEPTTALRVVAELARLRGTAAEELVRPIRAAYDRLVAPRTSGRPEG
jgi:TatD DNase family protein